MRTMKDSGIEWIGEIPVEWGTKAIRYVIDKHFSGVWGNDEKNDENDRICMRIADFNFEKLRFKDIQTEYYTTRNYRKSDIINKTLVRGDLLIEKSGGGEKTPVGRTVVFRLNNKALFANFMDCIRLKQNYDVEYIKYAFFSLYKRGVTNFYYNQTTGIQNLNMQRYFREVKLSVPPLTEQQLIADYLDKKCSEIDSLTTDINAQIETLEQYKRSVITEAVTKGLNPNAKMKDSGIEWVGEIPEEWEIKPLKYMTFSNKQNLAETTNADFEFNYIDIGSVVYGKGITNFQRMYFKDSPSRARRKVKYKDVIISTVRTYLKAVAQIHNNELPTVVSTGFLTLEAKENILSQYLYYAVQSETFIQKIEAYSVGITYPAITSSVAINIKITLPPLTEQKVIADYLDNKCSEIDKTITDKKQQLEILADYKKSLIYEYVTGKKEVKPNE